MAQSPSKPTPSVFGVGGIGNVLLELSAHGSALLVPAEEMSPMAFLKDCLFDWCCCLSYSFLQTPLNVGAWIPIVFICDRLPTPPTANDR